MTENEARKISKFASMHIAAVKQAQKLKYLQYFLLVVCWVPLVVAVYLKFSGTFTGLVMPLSIVAILGGIGSWLVGRKKDPLIRKIKEMHPVFSKITAEVEKADARSREKIPLSIGFYRFVGDKFSVKLEQDVEVLSPLFSRSIVAEIIAENDDFPRAEIIFVYARLDKSGLIHGRKTISIREIVELTNAAILVVATDNSTESIKKSLELPGQKTANIVFTLNRNGSAFSCFFVELFVKMKDGKHMLEAWAELAPQIPGNLSNNAPQTLLVAEGGKIAFPTSW